MSFDSNAVLQYIAENGPSVPNHIRQALGAQDNFVVGAVLSDLVSSGRLALTHFSYGSSKFYYDPTLPEKLEPLAQYLNEKDRRACELLRAQGVLRHSELSPLNRVAVASIQDYSRPVRVRTNDGEELFWRYYLLSEPEALALIEGQWFGKPKPVETPAAETVVVPPAPVQPEKQSVRGPSEQPAPKPKQESKSAQQEAKPLRAAKKTASTPFTEEITAYFSERGITVDEVLTSTKTEYSALISVPSAIGAAKYYCKAKSKKTTSDGDLASAYLEAQHARLPLFYLAAEKFSKKATDMLPTLKGAIVTSRAGKED